MQKAWAMQSGEHAECVTQSASQTLIRAAEHMHAEEPSRCK